MRGCRVGIIGGGAAGLCAAVLLSRERVPVTVFEALPRVGKKLLATGNGRCNLSNLGVSPARYRGDRDGIAAVLDGLSPAGVRDFFRSIGVYTYADEEGRVYPRSGTAAAVLDALRLYAAEHGAVIEAGAPVTAVRRVRDGFAVVRGDEEAAVGRLILASGGKAASAFDGYALAKSLGHGVTPLSPALCPVPVAEEAVRSLKGLRTQAAVRLLASGVTVRETRGEVQFADRALSGICVFELAGEAFVRRARGERVALELDLLPEEDDPRALLAALARAIPERAAEDFLSGLVPKRVGMAVLRGAFDGPMTTPVRELPRRVLDGTAARLRGWRFTPSGVSPWSAAQVTHGGVPLSELSRGTLESLRCAGLYIAGEALDVDGDCGGFNRHWAFASAHAAAADILRHLQKER